MKNYWFFTFLILFMLSTTGCKQKVSDIDSEKELVKAVIDNYAKSWMDEDMQLYDSTVLSDESLIYVGGSRGLDWIEGWTELEDIIIGQNKSFNETKISEKKAWVKISSSGDFAWAVTLWDLTTTLNDGTNCFIPLRCSWVLEKINASWYIVHFHKSIGIQSIRDYAVPG